jgi:hypothetical protein
LALVSISKLPGAVTARAPEIPKTRPAAINAKVTQSEIDLRLRLRRCLTSVTFHSFAMGGRGHGEKPRTLPVSSFQRKVNRRPVACNEKGLSRSPGAGYEGQRRRKSGQMPDLYAYSSGRPAIQVFAICLERVRRNEWKNAGSARART